MRDWGTQSYGQSARGRGLRRRESLLDDKLVVSFVASKSSAVRLDVSGSGDPVKRIGPRR